MKLVFAIVHNDDSAIVSSALTQKGFFVTKLSTTGGFLMVGNTTLLIGTEDEKVEEVKEIFKQYCVTRKQSVSPTEALGQGLRQSSIPNEIIVGGATIFVLSVDETVKL